MRSQGYIKPFGASAANPARKEWIVRHKKPLFADYYRRTGAV